MFLRLRHKITPLSLGGSPLPKSQLRALLALNLILSLWVARVYWSYQADNQTQLSNYFISLDSIPILKPLPLQSIEINTADSLDFLRLPAVGPKLTQRLLRYRKKKKYFRALEEIQQVYGFAEIYPNIAPYLKLDTIRLQALENQYAIRPPAYPQNLNLISRQALLQTRLLDSSLAARLLNYRDKKSGFRNWAEVERIYGLTPEEIQLLQRYYFIEAPKLEINQADSLALVQLPAIGPVLTARILKYKKLLGGYFYTVEQLKEVYGITPHAFEKFSRLLYVDTLALKKRKKIYINSASAEELAAHPYLQKNYKLAKRIVNFRNKYGPIRNSQDLAKIYDITPEMIEKIEPYLSYE
jgi:DNA uptake protein ComE-like DNA-binding protein